jgi:hypothetical protein
MRDLVCNPHESRSMRALLEFYLDQRNVRVGQTRSSTTNLLQPLRTDIGDVVSGLPDCLIPSVRSCIKARSPAT